MPVGFSTRRLLHWFALGVLTVIPGAAQSNLRAVRPILESQILHPEVATFQLRDYVVRRAAHLPETKDAAQWTKTAAQLREKILSDVVYHGWPKEWVTAAPKFEEGPVLTGKGYRIRKLRYEIVPGFQGVALLYEPENPSGKAPAVLNVTGHGDPGKAFEFKQKRCITYAQNGVYALNLEWMSYGELNQEGNQHIFGAHLDLAGANGLGMFYLAMRRGLDYLANHPGVDPERLGVTGLSGGGWQTIVLSSLDERVKVSVPVAGFTSTVSRVEDAAYGDLGDFEQNASDLFQGRDYPTLVAMRAPLPTLLVYNAEDDCCFRAALAKPFVYEGVRRFYSLYDKEDFLGWHENSDPGTHNYQLDNRQQAYRFFNRHFAWTGIEESPQVGAELRSGEELAVGVPDNNLTILGLAREFANKIVRKPLPADRPGRDAERKRLKDIIRLGTNPVDRVWTIAITKHGGVESRSHIFAMEGGLSADGVWLKAIDAPANAPITIVLDDKARVESTAVVVERINRGEQVLALDLSFTGSAWKDGDNWMLQQVIDTQGERPLGIRAGQLIALAKWLRERAGGAAVRVETNGIRSQVAALTAAAVEPGVFTEVVVRDGLKSLGYVFEKPLRFSDAPDLFCLDFYKETDIDRLIALAEPTTVTRP
ncbi:MAG: acetylxylan esterase [Bryobacterales bacterium]